MRGGVLLKDRERFFAVAVAGPNHQLVLVLVDL